VRGGHVDARARRRSGAVSVVLRGPVAWVGPAGMLVRVRVCECAMAMCARWQCRCACVAMQWRGVDGVARSRCVGGPGGDVGAHVLCRGLRLEVTSIQALVVQRGGGDTFVGLCVGTRGGGGVVVVVVFRGDARLCGVVWLVFGVSEWFSHWYSTVRLWVVLYDSLCEWLVVGATRWW